MEFRTFRTALPAVLLMVCTALLMIPAPAVAAPAATGWIRLAHLSPGTAEVDAYLGSFAGGTPPVMLRDIGYGEVSPYQSVPVGTYTATIVPAGAGPDAPPILTASARVDEGRAYTIAGLGGSDRPSGRVLSDDLTPPPAGAARVRLIQGSTIAPLVDVMAIEGPAIAQEARLGTSTGYAILPAGRWTLQVRPREGSAQTVTSAVELRPGSVSSLLVVDGANDTLSVRAIADSEGAAVMPTGGVDTGYGPVQPRRSSHAIATIAALAIAAPLAVAGILRWRRRE